MRKHYLQVSGLVAGSLLHIQGDHIFKLSFENLEFKNIPREERVAHQVLNFYLIIRLLYLISY
jgi:hypothetical protein